MKKLDGSQKLLISLAVAVGLLAVASYKSVFRKPAVASYRSPIQLNSGKLQAKGRNPAAVDQRLENSESVSSTVIVSCRNLLDLPQVDSSSIRIKSFDCGDAKEFQVINRSNGYESSTFLLEDKSLSTEFINLAEGPNQFEIKFSNGTTVLTKKIVINRTIAAATEIE